MKKQNKTKQKTKQNRNTSTLLHTSTQDFRSNLSAIRLSIRVHKRKGLNSVPFDRIPSATIDY